MTVALRDHDLVVHQGDVLDVLAAMPSRSVHCVVTSPPYYGLRDYGIAGQIGLEATPGEYVAKLREVFAEIKRVLRSDGTLWLNLGDSYATHQKGDGGQQASTLDGRLDLKRARHPLGADRPQKNMLGVPWRVAFALQDDGWILRNDVIWSKPNAMPESVRDRLSCRHEHLFLLAKSRRYWFDLDAIREPLAYPEALDGTRVFGGANKGGIAGVDATARRRGGNRYGAARPGPNREQSDNHDAAHPRGRNPGDVWTIPTSPYPEAHFATFPPALARRCILAGCPEGGTVLDLFAGSGTTLAVARQLGRRSVGIELNPDYIDLIRRRVGDPPLNFTEEATA